MIDPVKLYKHDMEHQMKAVTWGPRGKPGGKVGFGSLCYRVKHVDWTVHRLGAAHISNHPGGLADKTARAYGRNRHKLGSAGEFDPIQIQKAPVHSLLATSPRWGQGKAPSRPSRRVVSLPRGAGISRTGVGAAAAVNSGRFSKEDPEKRHKKLEKHFHSSHLKHKR